MNIVKVMIVDDEVLAIEYLRNLIPWEKHGFKIVAEATNGKKAIELYKKYHPEIIFVDISMPVMDGLQLSSKIVQYNNNTKIILLTSYKDFEYAKQAVKIGVSNYLLKHEVNEKNLLEELQITKNKLEKEEEIQRFKKQEIIKRILEGREFSSEDKVYWQENMEILNENFVLILAKKDTPYPILNINSIDEKINTDNYKEIFDLKKYFFTEDINYIDTIEIKPNLYTIVLSMKKINSKSQIRDILYSVITEIQKKYRENTKNTISIVVTPTLPNTVGISKAFKSAMNTIDYIIFVGTEKIIWSSEVHISQKQGVNLFNDELNDISQNVKDLNYDNIKTIINYIFEKISLHYWDLANFAKICRGLINTLENFRKDNNLIQINDLLENKKIDTALWYSVNNIKIWFVNEFKKAIVEVQQSNIWTYSRKIQIVIQYMHKHYKEELVIEKVAEEFDMSGVYLSQLFKKETGETFLKYLTNYRINVAKSLLVSNKYNVSEVAEMVGYNTSQYFSKIFNDATGVTPKYFMKTGGTSLK